MALVPGQLPLAQLGLRLSDPVGALWDKFSERIVNPELKRACRQIALHMTDELLWVSIENLRAPDLSFDEVSEIITQCGGKDSWVRSIQHLLNHKFRAEHSNIPASAALALPSQPSHMRPPKFDIGHEEVFSAQLHRKGELLLTKIPVSALLSCIKETTDPQENELTYNDSKRIMRKMYEWLAAQGHVEGDLEGSKQWAEQLYRIFPYPHGKTGWVRKLELRKSNGRRDSAQACVHSRVPHSLCARALPALPRANLVCALLAENLQREATGGDGRPDR